MALYERLVPVLETATESFELVFVDDRSPDDSWDLLLGLAAADDRVRACPAEPELRPARRDHGGSRRESRAVDRRHGLRPSGPARGDPTPARQGDARATTSSSRGACDGGSRWLRRLAGRAYFRVRNFFMRMDMGTEYSSLSLLSRKVVDAFLRGPRPRPPVHAHRALARLRARRDRVRARGALGGNELLHDARAGSGRASTASSSRRRSCSGGSSTSASRLALVGAAARRLVHRSPTSSSTRTQAGRASPCCCSRRRLHHHEPGRDRPLRREDLRPGQGPTALRRRRPVVENPSSGA